MAKKCCCNKKSCNHEPMAWTTLRALRNSGTLEVGCNYTVNNFSRGCLAGKVTGITLLATATNSLSMDADVDTTLDTVAWRGKYDIDTNRITSLEDNWDNRVYSQTGAEVDRFPWGSSLWREIVVDHADVYTDCVPTCTLRNVRFTTDQSINLTGTLGYIYNSQFNTDNIIDWRGTTVNVRDFTFNSTTDRAINQTLLVRFDGTTQSNFWSSYTGGAENRIQGGTFGRGQLRQTDGILRMYDAGQNDGLWQITKSGSGTTTQYRAHSSSYGRRFYKGAGVERDYYGNVHGISILDMTDGNFYYFTLDAYGRLFQTGGTCQRSSIRDGGNIRNNGFNIFACTHEGSYSTNLTANNTNKRRDQSGTNTFI